MLLITDKKKCRETESQSTYRKKSDLGDEKIHSLNHNLFHFIEKAKKKKQNTFLNLAPFRKLQQQKHKA